MPKPFPSLFFRVEPALKLACCHIGRENNNAVCACFFAEAAASSFQQLPSGRRGTQRGLWTTVIIRSGWGPTETTWPGTRLQVLHNLHTIAFKRVLLKIATTQSLPMRRRQLLGFRYEYVHGGIGVRRLAQFSQLAAAWEKGRKEREWIRERKEEGREGLIAYIYTVLPVAVPYRCLLMNDGSYSYHAGTRCIVQISIPTTNIFYRRIRITVGRKIRNWTFVDLFAVVHLRNKMHCCPIESLSWQTLIDEPF
jgi:hypothetical protein